MEKIIGNIEWEPNEASAQCRICGVLWSIIVTWRHHCRNCGRLVCDSCSRARIKPGPYLGAVRTCRDCVCSIESPGIKLISFFIAADHVNALGGVSPVPAAESLEIFDALSEVSTEPVAEGLEIVDALSEVSTEPVAEGLEIVDAISEVSTAPATESLKIFVPSSTETILLTVDEIPTYLRNSDLYQNLVDGESEEKIAIPVSHFKADDRVETLGDFALLLRVMHFWHLNSIPADLMLFCYLHDIQEWNTVLGNIAFHSLQLNPAVLEVLLSISKAECPIIRAMELSQDRIVEYLAGHSYFTHKAFPATAIAARLGRRDYLEVLVLHGFAWDERTCNEAAAEGHLACLAYAFENGCPWDDNVYVCAVAGGHLPCMQFLHSQGVPWHPEVCIEAIKCNQGQCFEFAQENGCPWDDRFILVAIQEKEDDHVWFDRVLQRTMNIHKDACTHAVHTGDMHALEMLHQRNAAWDTSTTAAAASKGDLEMLRYLLEGGCPANADACAHAAKGGFLRCIKLLREHSVACDERTTAAAARNGYLHVLVDVMMHGCPCDESTMVLAARHIPCLKYLIERLGFPPALQTRVIAAAALSGDLDCVIYLHKIGCRWDVTTTAAAARGGSDKVLDYITRHVCPCTSDAMVLAVASGSLPCLKLLLYNNLCQCPFAGGVLAGAALVNASITCLRFILSNFSNYPAADYVYVDCSEVPRVVGLLNDKNMLRCIKLMLELGWKWNTAFMSYLRHNKCVESRRFLCEQKRKCQSSTNSHFTHSLGTHYACSGYLHNHAYNMVDFDDPHLNVYSLREMCIKAWRYAGAYGCVDCLMCLYDQWMPGELRAMLAASQAGHDHALKFLLDHGCPPDEAVITAAASAGQVGCLHVLYKYNCPFDVRTSNAAAREGRFRTLDYAITKMSCPINYNTIKLAAAARFGSLECVKCLVVFGGAELRDDVFGAAFMRANAPCVQYLLEMGCPVRNFVFNGEIDLISVEKDEEFSQCIELAIKYGWTMDGNLVYFVNRSELTVCKEYIRKLQEVERRQREAVPAGHFVR